LGSEIEANAAGIGIPASGTSVFYWAHQYPFFGTRLDQLVAFFNPTLDRLEQNSPALWHFKKTVRGKN
jgi:hypothetical protein